MRPNQLLAVSLPHSPLTTPQQRVVVDVCARHLLTSHGLRSLAPGSPSYIGCYGGGARQRDGASHQGTTWGWSIGPFVGAHLRVYRDPALAQSFLQPLVRHLADRALGSNSEIFDGDPPVHAQWLLRPGLERRRAPACVERHERMKTDDLTGIRGRCHIMPRRADAGRRYDPRPWLADSAPPASTVWAG
jgi:hypothetical protein